MLMRSAARLIISVAEQRFAIGSRHLAPRGSPASTTTERPGTDSPINCDIVSSGSHKYTVACSVWIGIGPGN